jgi:hypothetical protein
MTVTRVTPGHGRRCGGQGAATRRGRGRP